MMRGNAADLPAGSRIFRRVAARDARRRRRDARSVHAAGAKERRLSQLRDSDSLERAGLRPCSGIPAGKRESRASRQHQGRSHAAVEEAGRRRGGTGIRGRRKPRGEVSRRDVSRMDARAVATHLARGNELASRAAQRSRRRAPSDARRGARACARERGSLLHRRTPVANRLHAAARAAGHRYPRRPPRLRQRRCVHASGRCRCDCRAAARAFSGEGRSGMGDAARWRDRAAHPHQAIGTSTGRTFTRTRSRCCCPRAPSSRCATRTTTPRRIVRTRIGLPGV